MRRTTMSQQPNVVSKEGLVVQEVKNSGEGWENVQYKRNTKKSFVIWKRTLTDVPFFGLVIAMKIIRLPSYEKYWTNDSLYKNIFFNLS